MGGYYTRKRTKPAFSRTLFRSMSSTFAGSGVFEYRYGNQEKQSTTSFYSQRPTDSVDAPKSFGRRDLLEPFYAYGSWKYDIGHPFFTERSTERLTHANYHVHARLTGGQTITIDGPLVPDYSGFGTSPIAIAPINTDYYGPLLIGRAVPTSPVANVLQSLAELKREGISLPGASFARALRYETSRLRSVGGEYLNVAFGWIPLVNDLTDVLHAVIDSARILEQLEKNSGRAVRRRRATEEMVVFRDYSVVNANRTWRPPTAGATSTYNALFEGYPAGPLRNSGPLERIDLVKEQYWFEGAFTYFFENGSDPISKLRVYEQKANLLLGTRLTPEVLWELAPWSWLVDWFTNFGTLFSNVSRFSADGLVMKYGYLMRHSTSTRTYTQNGVAFRGGGPGPFAITLQTERKERVRATPFGFGLNPNSFTARQWAILAALGLTKAPRSLY